MDSYDEYARRARLLAGVHGLTGWSTGGEGGSDETTESGGEEDGGDEKATANPAESRKSVYCSNMVRVGSKTLDKKSKKKSLRRL